MHCQSKVLLSMAIWLQKDHPTEKYSDFWWALCDSLNDEGGGKFNFAQSYTYQTETFMVHVHVMNEVYKSSIKENKSKTVAQCMFHTVIQWYCGMLNCYSGRHITSVLFHCDSPCYIICQKTLAIATRGTANGYNLNTRRYRFHE